MERQNEILEETAAQGKVSAESILQEISRDYGGEYSQIDKWYQIETGLWMRRISDSQYYVTQVIPLLEQSYLCYLHVLDITAYNSKQASNYARNVETIPENLPYDIRYMYPIGLSKDVESAGESFIASTEEMKNEWLNKMGIREDIR